MQFEVQRSFARSFEAVVAPPCADGPRAPCRYLISPIARPPWARRGLPSVACDLGGCEIAGEATMPLYSSRRPGPLGGSVRRGVLSSTVLHFVF